MRAKVIVKLKNGILDPQGEVIHRVARGLGFDQIQRIQVGKIFEVELMHSDVKKAMDDLKILAEKLLANTVMEDFDFYIE